MRETRPPKTNLWIGAAATAVAAVLFPRLEAVKNEDVWIWELDSEAQVLAPLIVVLTLALFALLGSWAWRRESRTNRPAKVALVSAVLGLAGVVAFWLSVPIILGGLAVTLGLEGRRRAATEGRGTQATRRDRARCCCVCRRSRYLAFGERTPWRMRLRSRAVSPIVSPNPPSRPRASRQSKRRPLVGELLVSRTGERRGNTAFFLRRKRLNRAP